MQSRPFAKQTYHRRRSAADHFVVATSEFWYEEEEEFDSLTDAVKPKNVVLLTAPRANIPEFQERSRKAFRGLVFHAALSSQIEIDLAKTVWAGRDGPPYFHKVRVRNSLDKAAADMNAANAFWHEVLSQNWRMELDYGLGVEIPNEDTLLVVCSYRTLQQLLESVAVSLESKAGKFITGDDFGGTLAVIRFSQNFLSNNSMIVNESTARQIQCGQLLLYTQDFSDISLQNVLHTTPCC